MNFSKGKVKSGAISAISLAQNKLSGVVCGNNSNSKPEEVIHALGRFATLPILSY